MSTDGDGIALLRSTIERQVVHPDIRTDCHHIHSSSVRGDLVAFTEPMRKMIDRVGHCLFSQRRPRLVVASIHFWIW